MQNRPLTCDQNGAVPASRIARRKKIRRGRGAAPVTEVPFPADAPPPVVRVGLPVSDLQRMIDAWIVYGQMRKWSVATQSLRHGILTRMLWYFRDQKIHYCDTEALRRFQLFVGKPSEGDQERWPNYKRTVAITAGTVDTYFRNIRAFFNFLVKEQVIEVSPVRAEDRPISRKDQPDPYTMEEMARMFAEAKKGTYPDRDIALVHFLFDTGLRVSEACSLLLGDIDILTGKGRVIGKGNKERNFYMSRKTARLLWKYAQQEQLRESDPIWIGEQGPMDRNGVYQAIERIGKRAHVPRPKPHRFRHTFATEFLRAGGDRGTLQELLGHEDPRMVQAYVQYANADMERNHRRCSPVEHFYESKRRK